MAMLLVIALGDGALLREGEPLTADNLRDGVRRAARALAPVAAAHQVVISLGKGPQVSLLSLQAVAQTAIETCPLESLAANADGMMGYLLEQALSNVLPPERSVVTLLTMAEVDPDDPAFAKPTTFVGPTYLHEEAEYLGARKGWAFRLDGDKWRRVVASPEPRRIMELESIKWLLERGTLVIAEGGGGIPAMCDKQRRERFTAADCVIDRDLASAVLAIELGADAFFLLTAADAVYADWERPRQRAVRRASPAALSALPLPAASMGAKVNAACRFVTATGRSAAIGAAPDLSRLVAGEAGTTVSATESGLIYGQAEFLTAAMKPNVEGRTSA
jgi:carbamate kinase